MYTVYILNTFQKKGGRTMEHARVSRSRLFTEIATLIAKRSTCTRATVGAVIVKHDRIISTGYGGAPSRMPHCITEGCEITSPEGGCERTVHAEVNAIAFAAKSGISTQDSQMYVTLSPCYNCAKLIINSGITSVFYGSLYRDTRSSDLFRKAGIDFRSWSSLDRRE